MVTPKKSEDGKRPEDQDFYSVNSLGGGIKTFTREDVKLAPKFCEEFLEKLQEFQGERNLREHWADVLVEEMVRDTFRFEHVLLAQADLGQLRYRVNGQHTCWARLELRDNPRYSQSVTLLTYQLKSEEDLRNLYSSFDQHGRRTRGHVIMAQLVGFQGWTDVNKGVIQQVSTALPLHQWEDAAERKKHDSRDIAYLLKTEQLELGVRVGKFLSEKAAGKNYAHVHRAPVVAAMISTFAKNVTAAQEFWIPVLEGTGFDKASDPRNRLRANLLSATVGVGNRTAGKKNLTQEEMYRMVVFAWNAWRGGEDRENLKTGAKGARPKIK